MEVVWTEKAAANLEYFKKQLRLQSGLEIVADRFFEKVVLRADRLISKPEWIGVPVKEYPGAGYRSLYVMDYRIVYRVSGDCVYIVSFLHKRMLIDNSDFGIRG